MSMLNEPFIHAVVAERARERDQLAHVHRLRISTSASGPAPRRVRRRRLFRTPLWAWRSWRRAVKRHERRPGIPDPIPSLRRMRDDVFAP